MYKKNRGMMRIIINADDLGSYPQVNAAIFELMDEKRITSATVQANGPHVKEAVKSAARFPKCSFGVHLCATDLPPLTNNPNLMPILDEAGCLSKKLYKATPTPALLHALYMEFSAQIRFLMSMGLGVSHIDSHHHVHTLPMMFPVLKAVQRCFRIRKVRITRNIYPLSHHLPKRTLYGKQVYNWSLRHLFRTITTQGFSDFLGFCEQAQQPGHLTYETVELMTHPGPPEYQTETRMLRSSWEELLSEPVQKISFFDL